MKNKAIQTVLLITPFAPPNIGGAESHLQEFYNYLLDRGFRVVLLTYQPLTTDLTAPAYEKRGRLEIYRFQWFGFNLFTTFEKFPPVFNFLYLTPYLLVRSFIYLLFNNRRIDVIHVFGLNAAFVARVLKMFFNKPLFLTVKAVYGFNPLSIFTQVSKWVLMKFDRIFVPGLETKEDFINTGYPAEKIVQFTYWVNTENFKPVRSKAILRKKLGWKNKFTVIYAGRLIGSKGIKYVLEAAGELPTIEFKILGDNGKELPRVLESTKRLRNVEFIGSVAHSEMNKYLAAADVYLYPVLFPEEASLAILESLACGVPVVTTHKGVGDYRLNDEVSLLVKPNVKDIIEKLKILYGNPRKLKKMARAGVKFVKDFDKPGAEFILDEYDILINRGN